MDAYKEYLDKEILNAAQKFEEAKKKAIHELEGMSTWTASDLGAGYACHIEDVTKWAAELQKLSQAYRVFESMQKETNIKKVKE